MQLRLTEPLEAAGTRALAALAAADWQAVPLAPGVWQLTAAGCVSEAWLRLREDACGTLLTLWLPDEGDCAARDRLCGAIEGLSGAATGADEALVKRLRRIEGQIRGLQRMLETQRECDAILTQFSAVNSALKQAAAILVSSHLVNCIREEIASGGDGSTVNQRLLNVLF